MGSTNHGTEIKRLSAMLAIVSLPACSSMPELSVPYYLPKSSLEVVVTQTASCNKDKTPILVTDVSINSNFYRDVRQSFNYGELGWGLSKANATIEFYDDGRLKGINTETTSQFGEALPIIFSLPSMISPQKQQFDETRVSTACDRLKTPEDEPLTLTVVRRGITDFESVSDTIQMESLTINPSDLEPLKELFGDLDVRYDIPIPETNSVTPDGDSALPPTLTDYSGPYIRLREPAKASVKVKLLRKGDPVVYQGSAWVPQHGVFYRLPVQKSAWFGSNSMELELSGSGRIAKLKYGTGGAGLGALTAGKAIGDSLAGESASDKALRLKAESDLIYAQQRLVKCRADPENCIE